MPSTFTSNTGIEKIADGEQTGLWGQTTNLNFDIVDRALNGSVEIVLSGTTHTLTTSSGELSDGQFAVLVFTGSLSGTNTVTIEPNTAQKLYFVGNTTSETIVLTQGSGPSVSVPPGLSKVVYSDGEGPTAGVFDITDTLSGSFTGDITSSSATITGGSVDGSPIGASVADTGAFTTLAASDNTTLGGTLGVTGDTTLGGTLGVTGDTTLGGTLGVTGAFTGAAAAFTDLTVTGVGEFTSTGAVKVPVGTEAQRPTPAAGQLRFNNETTQFEGYDGTAWGSIGGGATGGGGDQVFVQNDQVVTENYTIPADKNAMTTGPIDINPGVVVTVSTGARWVVI